MIIFYFHLSVKTLHSIVSLFIFTEIAQSNRGPLLSTRRQFSSCDRGFFVIYQFFRFHFHASASRFSQIIWVEYRNVADLAVHLQRLSESNAIKLSEKNKSYLVLRLINGNNILPDALFLKPFCAKSEAARRVSEYKFNRRVHEFCRRQCRLLCRGCIGLETPEKGSLNRSRRGERDPHPRSFHASRTSNPFI
jgi:hypothetical protein